MTPFNFQVLDISNSRVFDISTDYFNSLESSLTHLYVSKNHLANISQDVFGSLGQLQWLDLSENLIHHIDPDVFHRLTKLQVNTYPQKYFPLNFFFFSNYKFFQQILNLRNNNIFDIPPSTFNSMKNLRIVDLSENELKYLPELLFRDDSLESVSISRNEFIKIPFKSFSPDAANSLQELDVSHNMISSFHTPDLFSRFKVKITSSLSLLRILIVNLFQSLISLDVSKNRLTRIEDSAFKPLSNLLYLDLSYNSPLQILLNGRSFSGVEENLLFLGMNNISLNGVRILHPRPLLELFH